MLPNYQDDYKVMLDKLELIYFRYKDLESQLGDPGVVSDMQKFKKTSKEYKDLEPIVNAYLEYKNLLSNIDFNKQVLAEEKDAEMREMAKAELDEQLEQLPKLEDDIRFLLIPKDPEDDKNAILEIRAGTGGDEASIFAGDLLRMYLKYCENKGWTTEIMNENAGTAGGYKEVVVEVSGDGVYGVLKYESGVEAEEVDVEINPADIKKDVYRASGAGGQHVNKTESAVRLTHIPTNTIAECQDGRSQHKNYESAMKVLRTRLYEKALAVHNEAIAKQRKTLVSTGDRSAKIRTYNYPQGRVTDHRINLTMYNLGEIMNGDLQSIIDKLNFEENAEKLKVGGL